MCIYIYKLKWSRYRPGVAQRVGRGIALLFHDLGTRRRWVVSSTPWPHFTHGKDLVPIVQDTGWVPGPVWTGGKPRHNRDSIPDRPARSQSLYRLSYRAPKLNQYRNKLIMYTINTWQLPVLWRKALDQRVLQREELRSRSDGNFKLTNYVSRSKEYFNQRNSASGSGGDFNLRNSVSGSEGYFNLRNFASVSEKYFTLRNSAIVSDGYFNLMISVSGSHG